MTTAPIFPIPPMNTKVYEMSTDQAIEQEIQAKGANVAPRIKPDDIESIIAREHYFTAAHGVLGACVSDNAPMFADAQEPESPLHMVTICVLITKNGTKVIGVNEGPVSPENFDADMGKRMARQKAIDQLWPMLGYELRTKLAGG